MTQLSEITGIRPTTRTFRPSDELVDPYRVCGIEIEVENMLLFPHREVNREYWRVVEDGSLRNHGREFVSQTLFGEDLVKALTDIEYLLDNSNGEITHRCGLHVHLDVSGFAVDELVALTCIVALAEPWLFKYVGGNRNENIYCIPLVTTDSVISYYNGIKYGQNHEVVLAISNTYKYSAFNILPIVSQGSVEFRHHHGTWKKDEIIKWINILQQLLLAAQTYPGSSIANLPYSDIMPAVFGEFVDELCPEHEVDLNSWLLAKDFLNFNKLEDRFYENSDVYLNPSNLVARSA